MREIVTCFASKNCAVTVVARDAEKNMISLPYKAYGLPAIGNSANASLFKDFPKNDRMKSEYADIYRNKYIEELLEDVFSKDRFDVIYERYSLFCAVGLSFARKHNIPHILEVNAPLIDEASKYRQLIFGEVASAIEKALFDGSNRIISVSNELKNYIKNKSNKARVLVVPNGVRVDHFAPISVSGNDSSLKDEFTVGFLGSLKPWHGVEILIDAFAELTGQIDKCRLLIIGENKKHQEKLEQRCDKLGLKNKVTFTGAVEYNDIPGMLQKADVLVAPYPMIDNYYFSSLKVFEYMAAGKAIVASKIGQLATILTNERTALLVHPGDRVSLEKTLVRLGKDPKLRHRLGERALIEARHKHTWSQRTGLILKTINGLISVCKAEK